MLVAKSSRRRLRRRGATMAASSVRRPWRLGFVVGLATAWTPPNSQFVSRGRPVARPRPETAAPWPAPHGHRRSGGPRRGAATTGDELKAASVKSSKTSDVVVQHATHAADPLTALTTTKTPHAAAAAAPGTPPAPLPAIPTIVGVAPKKQRGARYAAELSEAYKRCGEITKIFSKTFYFGTTFFAEAKRNAVWAIYVWCRRTDDIVDSPLATMLGPERMARDLERWEERLDKIWHDEPTDSLDMALADAKVRYPDLDIAPYKDMIKGMLMDTPGHDLYKARYDTWADLELYCYRVAGTVGLMTLPVLGTAPGCTMAQAREPALSLGVAFQITNILRDVGEDALRGRIYLPLEDLERFGVTEQQIFDGVVDDNYKRLLDFEIDRAMHYYALAETGIAMLAPEARLAVASSLRVYRGILEKILENDYDNFRKRAYVSKLEKFLMLPQAWLDVNRGAATGNSGLGPRLAAKQRQQQQH